TSSVLARFDVERRALGWMEHPHIAGVLDAGRTPAGQPFFAMEFVEGVAITEHCARTQLDLPARLELFLQVCAGVQHAHGKGVLHRDLKPSNLLVEQRDGRAQVKIIDFGLARAIDPEHFALTAHTLAGQFVGTPDYMSPEQAGAGDDLDVRSDVYALGAVLFELLTGRTPLQLRELRADFAAIQRRIREVDPPVPSRCTSGKTARALRGDLDWIVGRALSKEPERRYGTVSALGDDVRRHLASEPIAAGPPTTAYRVRKFVRRNRGLVTAAITLLLTLLVGLFGTIAFATEAAAEARRADAKAEQFDLLANVALLDTLREEAAATYPPWPENADRLAAWQDRCHRPLTAALPAIRATIARLAEAAEPDAGERFLLATLRRTLPEIERELERLTPAMTERRDWAAVVEALTIDRFRDRWDALADELSPQIGLVPLGHNPVTGLPEFYHLRSAWDPTGGIAPADVPIPELRADGSVAVTADSGIVFVLVPGGAARVGRRPEDPGRDENTPPTSVELSSFLIARHELTQGQWRRLTGGERPSLYRQTVVKGGIEFAIDDRHPVENIDHPTVTSVLGRCGLELPTEVQWEFAARAGTSEGWFTGADPNSVAGYANVVDATSHRHAPNFVGTPRFDDGHTLHAPVGSFLPNRFGLYDTIGNVREWTRDRRTPWRMPARDGDGLRDGPPVGGAREYVYRGGGYTTDVEECRVYTRHSAVPTIRSPDLGLRAARRVY
ncbi:MAG: SUMF1/EgtB/PvdO family nonheme iron enzyme, partial [Planctomycetes bacterium]|nr:SUMF1/EgtB/PvdO family nonheme iron enzyme [Planctomycetota bacterium]